MASGSFCSEHSLGIRAEVVEVAGIGFTAGEFRFACGYTIKSIHAGDRVCQQWGRIQLHHLNGGIDICLFHIHCNFCL